MEFKKNDICRVIIEDIGTDGEGIGKIDGFTLFIKDGVTYGTVLGITFSGRASLSSLDISGSVIPAYIINSLPGRIPLIGHLFKDSEGGGLVGVKYTLTGTSGNPRVSFHPLSSIAPGILGRFFK